jgi:uncharacterized membrane protein (DUF2068 family)
MIETMPPDALQRRTLRAIAAVEAIKGCVAIAASLGLLSLVHHDLHHLAVLLIGHIGLDPGAHYPALILQDLDSLAHVRLTSLLGLAALYATVRFAEAVGLWHERPWGEWLGALSGALYVPFELRHWLHAPTPLGAAVIAVNLAVVGFLGWQLRRRRRRHPA